jgi:hypothetical protein
MVHFIILTLETSVENNRSQGQRKRVIGIECVKNMLTLGRFYQRTFTSTIFTDEHRHYLQYFLSKSDMYHAIKNNNKRMERI